MTLTVVACGDDAGPTEVPGDLAPTVAGTSPSGGATGAALNGGIVIRFSETVDVTGAWFSVVCATSGSHTAAVGGGAQILSLDPDADFTASESCTVTVFASQVADRDSDDPPNTMAADFTWSFTTAAGEVPPTVSATFPAGGATGVARTESIAIVFNEAVDVTGAWFSVVCATSGSHTAAVGAAAQIFTLDPDADFAANESCTVTVVASQVTDQDSDDPPDNMGADYAWSFTTGASLAP